MNWFRSPNWAISRRIALVVIAVVVGYRSYGDSISQWFLDPDPSTDLLITRSEFHPSQGEQLPLWFIGLRNTSSKFSYDHVMLEATYMDDSDRTIQVDRIVIDQLLGPGDEHLVGSRDAKPRQGATQGTLKLLGAEVVE